MVLSLVVVAVALCGCQTLGFYAQAIKGEYQLLAHEKPIPKLLAAPQTPPRLKERLQLIEALRAFAASALKLPVDNQYSKYVDVHRQFVVWNIEAAPEFSLQPKAWWYPFVGSLDYRGYFSEHGAQACAQGLRRKGWDVYVGGVEAYSTLGWFKDPVLNTFIFEPDSELAETLFHELGHQRVFASGDTDFNEAFATTVGQEGARRWLLARDDTGAYNRYLTELRRTSQFVHLVMDTRSQLEALYGDTETPDGKVKATQLKRGVPRAEMRQQKQRIFDEFHRRYAELRAQWGDHIEHDEWLSDEVNNAELNSVATYYDLLPDFERLLQSNGGDLEKFYQAADRLAKEPRIKRRQSLREEARG
jgi:predicted aminopeptidase